jgi:hypothetical protein
MPALGAPVFAILAYLDVVTTRNVHLRRRSFSVGLAEITPASTVFTACR